MSIFNLTDEKMKETSSTFTAHEIYQQPATWRKTCAQLAACKDELQAFIDQVVKQDDFDIVLTGAGTSEFVGNSLFQALNPKYDFKVKSYASTDLVPSPENFLSRTKPTLLVNFGRSGNSPESLGNVEAAEVVCQNLYHLFVTCNHEGTLSKLANTRHNCFAINPDPETRPVLRHDFQLQQYVSGYPSGLQPSTSWTRSPLRWRSWPSPVSTSSMTSSVWHRRSWTSSITTASSIWATSA